MSLNLSYKGMTQLTATSISHCETPIKHTIYLTTHRYRLALSCMGYMSLQVPIYCC